MLQRSSAKYVAVLYVLDMCLTALALFVARWLRIALPYGQTISPDGTMLRWPMFVLAVVIWSVTLVSFKVYDPHRFADIMDEIQTTIAAIAVATLALEGALYSSFRGLSLLLYIAFLCQDILLCLNARVVLRQGIRVQEADPAPMVAGLFDGR